MNNKLRREIKTLEAMIKLYCRENHKQSNGMCIQCADLYQYASKRIEKCPLGVRKTTCAKCTVHCFKKEYRDRIREVMRYSGPKMIYKHPLLAVFYFWDLKF